MSSLRQALLPALVLALLAACSGGSPPTPAVPQPTASPTLTPTVPAATPTPPPPVTELPPLPTPTAVDPCALVTQDEVDAVAGTPLAEGIPAGEPQVYSCTWTGDPEGPLGQVEIYLGDNAKKFLDIDRDVLDHEFTEVGGIAAEAWLEENSIFFRKGTLWVAVRLVRLNEPSENVEPLKEIARRIVGRIPG